VEVLWQRQDLGTCSRPTFPQTVSGALSENQSHCKLIASGALTDAGGLTPAFYGPSIWAAP